MYKITFYYWFETPYGGRITGDASVYCEDEYEVGPGIRQVVGSGLIVPINDTLRRYISPHQLIDVMIEKIKEKKEDGKIETSDTPRDEVLPIRRTRSRKTQDTPTDGV